MPNEALIDKIQNFLSGVVALGGASERTGIVTNLTVIDAAPAALPNHIIIEDDRDGDYIPALKVPGILYANGDTVNVLFIKGTEPVAYQLGSGTTNSPVAVSKLVSPDLTIDPVLAADNNGDLTAENDLILGDTARGRIVRPVSDYPLALTGGDGSHFLDNDSSFPAGWTETDAALATNTNDLYSYWYLEGSSGEVSWDYSIQTATDIENDVTAGKVGVWVTGPIVFADNQYAADVDYYFGIYRDNAGIDVDTFARVHLQWDSVTPQWQIRGEVKDSSSGTQHNGAWNVFSWPINNAIWVGSGIQNNAGKTNFNYVGINFFPQSGVSNALNHFTRIQQQAPTTALTYGTAWIRFHQTRGAGAKDRTLIGAWDRLQ